jgi:hypothetical protein
MMGLGSCNTTRRHQSMRQLVFAWLVGVVAVALVLCVLQVSAFTKEVRSIQLRFQMPNNNADSNSAGMDDKVYAVDMDIAVESFAKTARAICSHTQTPVQSPSQAQAQPLQITCDPEEVAHIAHTQFATQ